MSAEIAFYKKRADKKFYLNERQQRNSTGLSPQEFEAIAKYLEPFASRFVEFDYKECLNLFMTHVR